MKTKIATTFGLALMLGLGIFGAMLALGTFNAAPQVHAAVTATDVTVSPDKARETAQVTIVVSATQAVAVGQRVFVKFNDDTTVPSSIPTSNIKVKATVLTGGSGGATADPDQQVDAAAVTVSGQEVAITIGDMNTGTADPNIGDQGIAVDAKITITFLQAAGIVNPDLGSSAYTLTVWTDTETLPVASNPYTIYSDIDISSDSEPRGKTITVTGVGLNPDCTTCNIRFKGDTTIHGTGTIDSSGVFSGTISVDSGTASDTSSAALAVEVTDSTGATFTSDNSCATCDPDKVAQQFQNAAGATPSSTAAVNPGDDVEVTLEDFTATAGATIANNSTKIGSGTAANETGAAFVIDAAGSGTTPDDALYEFTVPAATIEGSYLVTITDGTKSATFTLEVEDEAALVLTVTPATASIGQFVTVSGTDFTEGTIAKGGLTGQGGAQLNPDDAINVDSTGKWSFTTRLDTLEASAALEDDDYEITAVQGSKTGESGTTFARTARTLTVDPDISAPGTSVLVSGTGMTVDTNEVTDTAEVTISSSGVALTGSFVFPVNTDGTFSGTITIPSNEEAKDLTITATDNAKDLNANATNNRTATDKLEVPSGTVTADPLSASTGQDVTISGENFPPNRTASVVTIGGADAIPTGGVTTLSDGTFSILLEVPAQATGGSLLPGAKIINVTFGQINGSTTDFSVPNPTISLDINEAQVEDKIVITGTGFNALTSVSTLTIGNADVNPSPAPRASRSGDLAATVTIPALNAGTYTVVLQTGTQFSATATFTALAEAATATPEPTAVPGEVLTEGTPTDVFAEVVEAVAGLQVWSFDAESQSWAFFDATLAEGHPANDLALVEAGDGVWMFNDTDSSQEVTMLGGTRTLFPGWNLVGLPG